MTREELLEKLSYKSLIAGFGGVTTLIEEGDVTIGDYLIVRQNERGEWLVWQQVLPKFQVGDRIRVRDTHGEGSIVKTIDYETGCYVFDHDVRGSYANIEYELMSYEPKAGDIVRKKGVEKPHYRISDNVEGLPGQGEFYMYEIMDAGCASAGCYISRYTLQQDYVLVERPESLQKKFDSFREQLNKAIKEDAIHFEVEIVLDGVRHRLITNPDFEDCRRCSLDKVCDRFKDAICNAFAGAGCHIFQRVEEEDMPKWKHGIYFGDKYVISDCNDEPILAKGNHYLVLAELEKLQKED